MSPSRLWRSKPLRKHLVYPHHFLWMNWFPEFPLEIVVLNARACEPLWIGILVPESTLALVDCSTRLSYLCKYDICRDRRSRKFFPGVVIFQETTQMFMYFMSNLCTVCVIQDRICVEMLKYTVKCEKQVHWFSTFQTIYALLSQIYYAKKRLFRNICLCKYSKVRVFWRNFFCLKNAVA